MMCKSPLILTFVFAILFASPYVSASDNGDSKEVDNELHLPLPLQLKPDWKSYYQVESKLLEKRIDLTRQTLDTLTKDIESEEQRAEIDQLINAIYSHYESLMILKKEEIPKPSLAWVPKDTYSLKIFLEVSDKIGALEAEIERRNKGLSRFNLLASEVRQSLNNTYARYASIEEQTFEKFIVGLEVMALGGRLLYLEEEISLVKEIIRMNQLELTRYEEERKLIDEKLIVNIDAAAIRKEIKETRNKLLKEGNRLVDLEAQTIKSIRDSSSKEAPKALFQELVNALIRESITEARLFFLEAQLVLNEALAQPKEVSYAEEVEPIKDFVDNTSEKIASWQDSLSVEIDQLSQSLAQSSQQEQNSLFEQRLKMTMSSRVLLEKLNRELSHIELITELIDENIIEKQSMIEQSSYVFESFWNKVTDHFESWFYFSLFEISGIPVTLINLLKAVIIILIFLGLSRIVKIAIDRFAKGKEKTTQPTLYTLSRIIHYFIITIGVLFALSTIGLTMSNMAIVLGALGIGIGFGLQNIVNNFLCGLSLLFERNVKVGDYLEIKGGEFGRVTEVNVQCTTLHTFDGKDVLVPNSAIVGDTVTNWTKRDPYQRIHVPFGVAYGSDQDQVRQVVHEASLKVPSTILSLPGIPKPEVWLVEFGDSSLNFELVVWVNILRSRGRNALRAAYLAEIERALKANNIHIPFPQRDLYIKSLPE